MFCLRVLQFSSFSKISRFYKEIVIYVVYEETVKLGEPRDFPFMKYALVYTLKCSYMINCICALSFRKGVWLLYTDKYLDLVLIERSFDDV